MNQPKEHDKWNCPGRVRSMIPCDCKYVTGYERVNGHLIGCENKNVTHEQMARVIRHEEQERLIGMIEWYISQTDNKEAQAVLRILIKTLEHNETLEAKTESHE